MVLALATISSTLNGLLTKSATLVSAALCRQRACKHLFKCGDDVGSESFDIIMIVGHPADYRPSLRQPALLLWLQIAAIGGKPGKCINGHLGPPLPISLRPRLLACFNNNPFNEIRRNARLPALVNSFNRPCHTLISHYLGRYQTKGTRLLHLPSGTEPSK